MNFTEFRRSAVYAAASFVMLTVSLDVATAMVDRASLKPDSVTDVTAEVRTVSGNPKVHIVVKVKLKTVLDCDLDGKPGWIPSVLESLKSTDLDGDGMGETLVTTSANNGGSGSAAYLHVIHREGNRVHLFRLDTAMENVHSGEFLVAHKGGKPCGIVVTKPLVDGASRAESTHWNVSSYRLAKTGFILVKKSVSKQRYSELLPAKAIQELIPSGWKLP